MARSRRSKAGEETKARIVDAAVATLVEDGLLDATARAIADRGGFNQALIFYHFGTVEDLLLVAAQEGSDRHREKSREVLEQADTLADLIRLGLTLRDDPAISANVALTAQLMAGAANDDERRAQLRQILQPTIDDIADFADRVLSGTPLDGQVPAGDLAWAISAIFYGVQLLSAIDEDDTRTSSMFDSLTSLSATAEGLLGLLAAAKPTQ